MNMYLSTESEQLSSVYSYITNDSQYKKLKFIPRHSFTNTYDHSIRVALLASKIAKKIAFSSLILFTPPAINSLSTNET